MNNLDNLKQIKKLDPAKVLESTQSLDKQINQAWVELKKLKIPNDYKQVKQVVLNGMGGSGLPGHMVSALFFEDLKIPYTVINSYQAPASVNKDTLYIFSSYSGSTEEPLATLPAVKKAKAKMFAIGSGANLASLVKKGIMPGYIFDPKFNPSNQPRMGIGYSLGANLGLMNKLGLIKITDNEIKNCLVTVGRLQNKFGVNVPTKNNLAKKLALQLFNKMPVVTASEFLAGNAHTFANQINENAKIFSSYFLISEMNHHLLEGLKFPTTNKNNLFFLFFESKLYQPKNQIRYKITQKVVAKNKIKLFTYKLSAQTKLEQSFEMLLLGSYVSFYLAILNNLNPSKIPWVDYFKAELKKVS
ncbi:MAG: SIS domain-containing protein [Candidatus Buchananbacteria bacterium]